MLKSQFIPHFDHLYEGLLVWIRGEVYKELWFTLN